MAQPSDAEIKSILENTRTIAVVGASPNPDRPSFEVSAYLIRAGYKVIPVNPGHAGKEIAGQMTYASLSDVPEPVDMVDVFRASDAVPGVVEEALMLDPLPKVIWMQLGVRNEAAAAQAEAAGITVVQDRCPKIERMRLFGR